MTSWLKTVLGGIGLAAALFYGLMLVVIGFFAGWLWTQFGVGAFLMLVLVFAAYAVVQIGFNALIQSALRLFGRRADTDRVPLISEGTLSVIHIVIPLLVFLGMGIAFIADRVGGGQ